jgi:hypothetical protein
MFSNMLQDRRGSKLNLIQRAPGAGAGAAGLKVGCAVAFEAGPVESFADGAGYLVQGVSQPQSAALTRAFSRRERGRNRPMGIVLEADFGVSGVVKDHPLAVAADLTGSKAGFQIAVPALFGDSVQIFDKGAFHLSGERGVPSGE